jgi:hypothetical protein
MNGEVLPREDFLEELRWRGFVEQCTDEAGLQELLAAGPVTAYIGFDPSADCPSWGSCTCSGTVIVLWPSWAVAPA